MKTYKFSFLVYRYTMELGDNRANTADWPMRPDVVGRGSLQSRAYGGTMTKRVRPKTIGRPHSGNLDRGQLAQWAMAAPRRPTSALARWASGEGAATTVGRRPTSECGGSGLTLFQVKEVGFWMHCRFAKFGGYIVWSGKSCWLAMEWPTGKVWFRKIRRKFFCFSFSLIQIEFYIHLKKLQGILSLGLGFQFVFSV